MRSAGAVRAQTACGEPDCGKFAYCWVTSPHAGLIAILCIVALILLAGAARGSRSATMETYFGTIQAIAEHGTFALDATDYVYTIDKVRVQDHFYTHKPLLLPLIGSIVYWPMWEAGISLHNPRTRRTAETLISFLLCGISFLFAIAAFYWALAAIATGGIARVTVTAVFALCTLMLSFSTALNGQAFAAAWITVSVACLIQWVARKRRRSLLLAAGMALALAAGADHAACIYVVAFGLCILYRRRSLTDVLVFALPVVLAMAVSLQLNHRLTGSLQPLSSQIHLFKYPGSWWSSGRESLSGHLNTPAFALQYGLLCLVGPQGFFLFNPILVVALWFAIREITRRRCWAPEALATLAATTGIIVFYSFTSSNFSGYSYSVRWFLLFVPPAMFFLVRLFEKPGRLPLRIFTTCAAAGLVIALIGAYNPFPPHNTYEPVYITRIKDVVFTLASHR